MRRWLDWFFRNRITGAITIGQWPNPPLLAFGVFALIDWVVAPGGQVGLALQILSRAALAVWAADEVLRGVNPWRRCLGGGILAGLAWTAIRAVS